MITVGNALGDAEQTLTAAGVETPRLDARVLMAHVLGWQTGRVAVHADLTLDADRFDRFQTLVRRRAQRQPVSQIVGRRGFWTLDLSVTQDTLDPRPDSETLIEAVLDRFPDRTANLSVLDLGTGTGCLLLAVLSEYPGADGVGVDISADALAVAMANAEACGLSHRARFLQGRWGGALDGGFDLIISNPPYIPDGDHIHLAPEVVRWEPHLALFGGADGLNCYRQLMPDAARLLSAGGAVVLEVGIGQAAAVLEIGAENGLRGGPVRRDLGGIERCVILNSQV